MIKNKEKIKYTMKTLSLNITVIEDSACVHVCVHMCVCTCVCARVEMEHSERGGGGKRKLKTAGRRTI